MYSCRGRCSRGTGLGLVLRVRVSTDLLTSMEWIMSAEREMVTTDTTLRTHLDRSRDDVRLCIVKCGSVNDAGFGEDCDV
jgi:hypothetical protein